MKKERRWLKSAIAAAADCQTIMPFQRRAKGRPASMKAAAQQRSATGSRRSKPSI